MVTGFFDVFRHAVFKRFVLKKMNKNVVHKVLSVKSAQKVGLLFQADELSQRDSIQSYADRLKKDGKDVQMLGFLNQRNPQVNYLFPYITKKDVTWFGKPKGGTTGYFIKYPFDILINFAPKELIPFEYISALSRSRCRIGFNEKNLLEPYDCILLAEKREDIDGLINDIDKYLS